MNTNQIEHNDKIEAGAKGEDCYLDGDDMTDGEPDYTSYHGDGLTEEQLADMEVYWEMNTYYSNI